MVEMEEFFNNKTLFETYVIRYNVDIDHTFDNIKNIHQMIESEGGYTEKIDQMTSSCIKPYFLFFKNFYQYHDIRYISMVYVFILHTLSHPRVYSIYRVFVSHLLCGGLVDKTDVVACDDVKDMTKLQILETIQKIIGEHFGRLIAFLITLESNL